MYSDSESGMVEYDPNNESIVNTIEYPPMTQNLERICPRSHFCCAYKDKIYIIDGYRGEIILFNPESKVYTHLLNILTIGSYCCAAVMHDQIHIMHGDSSRDHYIYDIESNKIIKKIENIQPLDEISYVVSILTYKNRIIKFGGYAGNVTIDTFMMSSVIKKGDYNIKWEIKPEWKLPTTLYRFGCVIYKHYILIFGGCQWDSVDKPIFHDSIFVLDLEGGDKAGWKELTHIKCPIASKYMAIHTSSSS